MNNNIVLDNNDNDLNIDLEISQIEKQIKLLAEKRNLLCKQVRDNTIREKDENLKQINNAQLNLDDKINKCNDEIYHLKNNIKTIEKQIANINDRIIQYDKEYHNLEKQKCPILGHHWDYNYELMDTKGGVEEHCIVCGTPRTD